MQQHTTAHYNSRQDSATSGSQQRATTNDVNTETRGPAAPLYDAVMQALASKGWTKTRLWRESGVARSTIEAWETAPRPPQAATVHAVADALGIKRSEALRLAGIIIPGAAQPAGDAGPAEPVEDVDRVAERLLNQLRSVADREDKSIGDILVERGLATRDELMLSEEKRGDRYVKDILGSNLPEDTKNKILMDYVIDRRHSFRDAGLIGPPEEK